MRVLAFSDVHCDLGAVESIVERSADADLVVGAGDFASVHSGLEETVAFLQATEPPLVLVPGNNETEDALRSAARDQATVVKVLHGEGFRIHFSTGEDGGYAPLDGGDDADALRLWGLGAGIPTTPWDWSFDLSEEEAAERLEDCPDDLDLLILHSPPYGHCDVSGSGEHLGSGAILRAIEEKQPRVAVCGHIHESWTEQSVIGETRLYNLGPDGLVIDL